MKKPATSETPCQPHVERQLPLPLLSCLKAVREGFFELCIHVGEQALHALMEQDRTALCGARWSRDPSRRAVRGGSTASEITLGGRRIRVRRRRAAQVDGPELALPSFGWAADRDPLDEHTWRSIVAGVSTRSYGASLAPVPNEFQQRSTSRSAVSRRFVALSQRQLTTCLSRPLGDLDLQVVMIDGIDYHDHTILVALGIDARGTKHVLRAHCSVTWSTAGSRGISRCCSSSPAARRSAKRSAAWSGRSASSNAARCTSCAMCLSTCPRICVPRCGMRCVRPTMRPHRPPRRSASSSGWRGRWTPIIRVPPLPYAKGSRRR